MISPTSAAPFPRRGQQARLSDTVARWLIGRTGIACSGGVDSTALLLAASHAAQRRTIPPIVALHVDHKSRAESADDARLVASLCRQLDVPCCRLEVSCLKMDTRESLEQRLRVLRYDALACAAFRLGLDAVATAHTADDQVETILLRLFSGSGTSGAAGMRRESTLPTRCGALRVIRPFLDVRRSQCEETVAEAGLVAFQDPTNSDTRFKRNALRHVVIPAIREHFDGFETALIRSVELAARDGEYVDAVAKESFDSVVASGRSTYSLPRAWMRDEPVPIVSRVIRDVFSRLAEGDLRELSAERVEAVRTAASGRTGARIELPHGVRVCVERDLLLFGHGEERAGT